MQTYRRNWRSKSRIPKVSNEDSDIEVSHIGKRAKLRVCSWHAHTDTSSEDDRLSQADSKQEASQEASSNLLVWFIVKEWPLLSDKLTLKHDQVRITLRGKKGRQQHNWSTETQVTSCVIRRTPRSTFQRTCSHTVEKYKEEIQTSNLIELIRN